MFLASKKMKKERGRERSSMMPPFLLLPYIQSGTYVGGQVPIYLSPAQALNILLPSRDLTSSPSLSFFYHLPYFTVSQVLCIKADQLLEFYCRSLNLDSHTENQEICRGGHPGLSLLTSQRTFHQDIWKPQLTITSFRTPRSLRLKLRAVCHASLCWWTGLVSTSLPPAVVDALKPSH